MNKPRSVAVADVNGDTRVDVVTIMFADWGGTLAALETAQLNDAGALDLVVTDTDQSGVWVLIGVGDGTFRNPIFLPTGEFPFSLAIGDLDGDGLPDDIVVARPAANVVSVIHNLTKEDNFAGVPDTAIASGPQGLTNQTRPTFTFSSTQEPKRFECRIDAAPYVACESGDTFGPLADGEHTFHVRAIDINENTDPTPAERRFEVRACTISGTQSGNRLRGTAGNDVLCGFGGNDTITPGGGHDVVFGGPGNDVVKASPGNDRLWGQDGDDSLSGGAGNDELNGGLGTDFCDGGRGTDTASACEQVRGVP